MAGWNRRLVLSLSVVATIHIIAAQPGMAFPIQTNAASARRYLNENTLYDDGTRSLCAACTIAGANVPAPDISKHSSATKVPLTKPFAVA